MSTRFLTCGLAIGIALLSCSAQGGGCSPEAETHEHSQRMIDGPANVRLTPAGKAIGSIPDQTAVTLTGFREVSGNGRPAVWYHVSWVQNGQSRSGWTHEQNIICD